MAFVYDFYNFYQDILERYKTSITKVVKAEEKKKQKFHKNSKMKQKILFDSGNIPSSNNRNEITLFERIWNCDRKKTHKKYG